jgi:F0F1-type ATP synthase membrane subunit b/b'
MSLDDLQAQLRGTLDQQFAALNKKYEDGLADARRQAVEEAERELAIRLHAARVEWDAQLPGIMAAARAEWDAQVPGIMAAARAEVESQVPAIVAAARAEWDSQRPAIVAAARAEWESQMNAVVAAARAEAEQQASTALERQRQEHAQAISQVLTSAKRTADLEIESERRRAQTEIDAERRRTQSEIEAAVQKAAAEAAHRDQLKTEADLERQRATAALETERQQAKAALETERQQATAAIETERRRLTSELDTERQHLKTELAAERQRAQAEIEGLRQRMQAEIAAARQAGAASVKPASAPASAPAVSPAAVDRLAAAIREIDSAVTLSQALESLLTHAAAAAGRAAIFLINGDRLKAWKATRIPDVDVQTVESSIGGQDLLARAIQAGQSTASSAALPAPPFARLPPERGGFAVPLMIGGRAVAVLYADSGAAAPPAGSPHIVESLVRHASAVVALRTAMRTLEVLDGGAADAAGADVSDDQGARRYARLLVSEIKLYNEGAVRTGREHRDLLQRLRAEIDRAQRLYEERVPPAVGGRHVYFQQELVQTLADGDPALLGNT